MARMCSGQVLITQKKWTFLELLNILRLSLIETPLINRVTTPY